MRRRELRNPQPRFAMNAFSAYVGGAGTELVDQRIQCRGFRPASGLQRLFVLLVPHVGFEEPLSEERPDVQDGDPGALRLTKRQRDVDDVPVQFPGLRDV